MEIEQLMGAKPEPRIKTTMRIRESIADALDREVECSGAVSRTALLEAILTKYLRSRGYKSLKPRSLL